MDVRAHFRIPGLGRRIPGLGRRVSGSGLQVQVPGLIPEPAPAPVPAAETWYQRMCSRHPGPGAATCHPRMGSLLGQHAVLPLPALSIQPQASEITPIDLDLPSGRRWASFNPNHLPKIRWLRRCLRGESDNKSGSPLLFPLSKPSLHLDQFWHAQESLPRSRHVGILQSRRNQRAEPERCLLILFQADVLWVGWVVCRWLLLSL